MEVVIILVREFILNHFALHKEIRGYFFWLIFVVGLTLEVTFTKEYPNEFPEFKIRDSFGIDSNQVKEIETKIKQRVILSLFSIWLDQAEESIGMPMVFNLASAAKEWLDDNNFSKEEKVKLKQLKVEQEKEVPICKKHFNQLIMIRKNALREHQ